MDVQRVSADGEAISDLVEDVGRRGRPAVDRLFPILYQELKRIARRHRRRERWDHTLNTTGLVHEAYVKLLGLDRINWQNRAHFLAVAAQAMRRVLVDYAEGGQKQLLTGTHFGMVPQESPEGWIYDSLQADSAPTKIRRIRPGGRDASDVVAEDIAGRSFVVVEGGIWHMTPNSRPQRGQLRFYDFASKLTRTVYQTNLPIGPGLTLRPDGRRILFTHRDRTGSDLMLIENFR